MVAGGSVSRVELLEQHGRAYGKLRLAVAFTAGLEGDDAKRVTLAGWDRTRRSPTPSRAPPSCATAARSETPPSCFDRPGSSAST